MRVWDGAGTPCQPCVSATGSFLSRPQLPAPTAAQLHSGTVLGPNWIIMKHESCLTYGYSWYVNQYWCLRRFWSRGLFVTYSLATTDENENLADIKPAMSIETKTSSTLRYFEWFCLTYRSDAFSGILSGILPGASSHRLSCINSVWLYGAYTSIQ